MDPSQNAIQESPARNPGGSTGGTIKSSNEQFPNNQNQPVLGQTQPASGRQANNRNTPVVGQTQPATGQQPNNQIPTTNTNENTNTSTSSPSLVAQSTSTIFTTQIPASQQPDPPISNSPSSNPTFSTQNIALIAAGGSLALVILIGIVALLYYRRWKKGNISDRRSLHSNEGGEPLVFSTLEERSSSPLGNILHTPAFASSSKATPVKKVSPQTSPETPLSIIYQPESPASSPTSSKSDQSNRSKATFGS